jgi:hypothetical protein
MNFDNIEELKKAGFEGFKSFKELNIKNDIPKEGGVYLVLDEIQKKDFLIESEIGKRYYIKKGKEIELLYTEDELKEKFIPNSLTIYIGQSKNLKTRLGTYLKYGKNNIIKERISTPHRGGKAIWQLRHYEDLIFCWKIIEPEKEEAKLLKEFENQKKEKLPFANFQKGKKINSNKNN